MISPKPRSADWYPYYAGFSREFVRFILEGTARRFRDEFVLDPWAGSGTVLVEAAALGLAATGVDANPAAVVIARARLATRAELKAGSEALAEAPRATTADPDDPLLEWFDSRTVGLLRTIVRALIPGDVGVASAGNCAVVASIFLVVRSRTNQFRGSNPTWVRPGTDAAKVSISRADLQREVEAELDKLAICALNPPLGAEVRVALADARKLPIEDGTVSLLIGSPPYANRLDYAVHTRVELAVLGIGAERFREVRQGLFGNALVAAPGGVFTTPRLSSVLATISAHRSYAAKRYYWKNYVAYFSALQDCMAEVDRVGTTNSMVVLVVQNSYFKELEIPLAEIVEEMLPGWSFSRSDFPTKSTRAAMNPKSRENRTSHTAVESVLVGVRR